MGIVRKPVVKKKTEQPESLDHVVAFRQAAEKDYIYPEGKYSGRGIVTCAGGRRLSIQVWVLIHMLRYHGCKLPIEVWYLGKAEEYPTVQKLLEPLGVTFINTREVQKTYPHPRLNGWESKCYAVMHSKFEEVLFLDCDNSPTRDVTELFSWPEYKEHGCVFWPDRGRILKSSKIWTLTGVPYQDENEFESGQMLINKKECWKALVLSEHLNEHSEFWYRQWHGDKETFHFGWRAANKSYAMAPYLHDENSTMYQKDFAGTILFQHRNGRNFKWSLWDRKNSRGFKDELVCFDYLDELKRKFGVMVQLPAPQGSVGDEAAVKGLLSQLGSNVTLVTYGEKDWQFLGYPTIQIQDHEAIKNHEAAEYYVIGADAIDGSYYNLGPLKLIEAANVAAESGKHVCVCAFSYAKGGSEVVRKNFKRLSKHPNVSFKVRDAISLENFCSQVLTDRVRCTVDPAFLLPNGEVDASIREAIEQARQDGKFIMGLNINGVLEDHHRDYLASHKVLADLKDVFFVLIPHDTRSGQDDRPFLKKAQVWLPDCLMATPKCAEEAKGITSLCDGVITGRMHLAIAALGNGVPVVAWDYVEKVRGLFYMIDCSELLVEKSSDFASKVQALIGENDRWRNLINERHNELIELAKANIL